MVLKMEPYNLPASGEDQYRVFVLDGVIPKGKILKAFEFKPGDNTVVHHSTVFVDYTGSLKQYDQEDSKPGYNAFEKGGTMEFGSAITIGNWAPGIDVYQYPDNIGFYIQSKADVAIENHYHLSGKETTDQSSVALYFADYSDVSEYASGSIIGNQRLHIKAGETNHTQKIWVYVPVDIKLIDVAPHMHYIGKSVNLEIIEPNGNRKALLRVDDWDLRWQGAYSLREPMLVKQGSIIEGVFTYDNSDDNHDNPNYPAKEMFWGWGSSDEMLEFYLTYVPSSVNDYGKMIGSSFAAFEHFYDADKRIFVNESNLQKVYEEFRKVDVLSDKGQIYLISIVESSLGGQILKQFEADKLKFKNDANFIINHSQLIISESYYSFDESNIIQAGSKAANQAPTLNTTKNCIYPFIQLLLEFANNSLISGVAHVVYTQILRDPT